MSTKTISESNPLSIIQQKYNWTQNVLKVKDDYSKFWVDPVLFTRWYLILTARINTIPEPFVLQICKKKPLSDVLPDFSSLLEFLKEEALLEDLDLESFKLQTEFNQAYQQFKLAQTQCIGAGNIIEEIEVNDRSIKDFAVQYNLEIHNYHIQ